MRGQSLLQRASRRLDKSFSSLFFIDQWVIMFAKEAEYDSLRWAEFQPILPDKDRYWGDPFVVPRDGNYFVFVEEKLYETGRGRIACLTLDADGRLLSHEVVLERSYHLSYPFLFEQGGQLFMIPESAGNRTVELYRCTHFPGRWEFIKTLMDGVYAVDATLLEHEHRHWLFANVKEAGGSSLDALHLFWAEDLLTDKWTPHPLNPIVKDIRSARPAGRIFMHNGKLIRPAQDSAYRYGHALNFNRIMKLSEHEYEETIEARFEPSGGKILATHTFNQASRLTVIDAVIRRRK